MADSKRQKIVDAVVAALEEISVANGFETELGANVNDWEINFQDDELPAVSVCDLTEDVQADMNDEHVDIYRLPVAIRVSIAADTRAAECRKMIADVLKAVGANENWTVSGEKLALRTDLKEAGFVLDQEAFRIAAVQVQIEIYYHTERWNYYVT